MKHIDESRLETDLSYRYEFLTEFIGFTNDDVNSIHSLAEKLHPQIPKLVQATYDKLLHYTATARHFLSRQSGFDGSLPDGLEALSQNTEQIQFRKEHLRRYLLTLLCNPYDVRMTKYLDVVGKIHTPKAGNKQIDVPLVQMNALMGVLSDVLIQAIYDCHLHPEAEREAIRAFNKLLWIQNDLINRHYSHSNGTPQLDQQQNRPSHSQTPTESPWR